MSHFVFEEAIEELTLLGIISWEFQTAFTFWNPLIINLYDQFCIFIKAIYNFWSNKSIKLINLISGMNFKFK